MIFKNIFKKEKKYECIVWDGKIITYLFLSQKDIDKMIKKNNNLTITKKEDI